MKLKSSVLSKFTFDGQDAFLRKKIFSGISVRERQINRQIWALLQEKLIETICLMRIYSIPRALLSPLSGSQ